jgi:hypothetical protein
MRRSVVTTTVTLALSLAPAVLFAQTAQQPPAGQPPAGQPPAGQPPAGQPPAGQQPGAAATSKEPRLALTGAAGVFLYQIKPDQTATFEELLTKVKQSLGKSDNPVRKQQLNGWKVYKAAEPMGGNALYVFVIDPAVPAAEYDLFMLLAEGLGAEVGTPENQAMFKKYQEVFAAGANRLNLSPVAAFNGGL